MIYHIAFPKLNINLTVSTVLTRFMGLTIYSYGAIIAIAFVAAYFYILKNCIKHSINENTMSSIILSATLCAILGARAYYVIFYPGDFYKKHPENIFMISEGGIAIYGAIIGGILGTIIAAKMKNQPLKPTLDLLSLGVCLGQSIGRWGNFVNQEAFGSVTGSILGMASENTGEQTVHPCFLYESAGCLALFLILNFYYSKSKKIKHGNVFLIYTLGYGIIRYFIEDLRTDSLIVPYTNIKISQLLALATAIMSFCVLTKRFFPKINPN